MIGGLDALFRRPRLEPLERRDHQDRAELASVAHDDRLVHVRVLLQHVLDRLRRHVLAARGLDKVLLPVGDLQVSVAAQLADVPGAEPPVLGNHFTGHVLQPVVALHHLRPANQDFPVVGDRDLGAGHRAADRPDPEVLEGVDIRDRRRLAETVSLQDRNARAQEEAVDFRSQCRASAHEVPEPPAHGLPDLPEHQLVRYRVLQAQEERNLRALLSVQRASTPHTRRPGDQPALDATGIQHALIDLLVQARHRDQHGRLQALHVRRHGLDRTVRDRASRREEDIVHHALENVRQGQEGDAAVVFVQGQDLARRLDVRGEVVMAQHHSLGRSRGARGVDHRGQVIGPGPPRFRHEVVHRSVVAGRHEVVPAGRPVQVVAPVEHDNLQVESLAPCRILHLRVLFGVRHKDERSARVLQDVGHLRHGQRAVDGNVHRPRAQARPVGQRPLQPVLRENGHPVAASDPAARERRSPAPRLVAHLLVRERSAVRSRIVGIVVRHSLAGVKEELDERAFRDVRRVGKVVDRVGHGTASLPR